MNVSQRGRGWWNGADVQKHHIEMIEAISNLYTWCRSTHGWTLSFLETIGPIEPPIWGKCAPKTSVLAFIQSVWNFSRKKVVNSMWYPIPHRKGSTHFYCPSPTLPQKWLCPPKIIFHDYFGKKFFFLKKLFNEKYLKPHFLRKRLYWILSLDASFPSKQACPPIDGFFTIYLENAAF